ncbi:MAG TPA: TFIIB-type zinc ribbon-containing protein [Bryobacterales bacterium]|nr:TFIIB-type zinc ribbon-containing protein [Bryobacterales bacterium]
MKCPNCGRKLTILDAARMRCSQCGRRIDRTALGLVKTSSVRVATGEGDRVYNSVEDLPPELRRQFQRAMSSPDAETILIADESGREQVFQVIHDLPPHVQKKVLASLRLPDQAPASFFASLHKWRFLLAAGGLAGLAALLWWVWR